MFSKLARLVFIFLLPSLFVAAPVSAVVDNAFVTVIHPVRGRDVSKNGIGRNALEIQTDVVARNKIPATWLLDYDALADSDIVEYFRDIHDSDEIGIFMEVSEKLTQAAGVEYSAGPGWYRANNIFLSGYEPEERIKLVDTVFRRFEREFGLRPKSVGAWHLDAFSLAYMKERYKITGGLVVADQLTTDGYGLWGQYWGMPFYPSKKNVLMPANSLHTKLDVVLVQWAPRDPLNGYGAGSKESTYSVQANDYRNYHNLDMEYFKKLADLYTTPGDNGYGYLVVGLEAGEFADLYTTEYAKQIDYLSEKARAGKLKFVALKAFSEWYKKRFPDLSPPYKLRTKDILGSDATITWYMSPWYRMGVLYSDRGTEIIDWRLYDNNIYERFYNASNEQISLDMSVPAKVDSVRPVGKPILVASEKVEVVYKPQETRFSNGLTLNAQTSGFKELKLPLLFGLYVVLLIGVVKMARAQLLLVIVFLAGVVGWSMTMVKSGLLYPFGMGFWGPNGHDGIWHIALANHLARGSLEMPIFAGEQLKNYHWFYDEFLALLRRLTSIPAHTLYFQVFPPILAVLLGCLVYRFVFKWRGSTTQALFALFFVFFGGSWGWMVNLLRGRPVGGESMFWANQAVSTLINPPFAISLVLLLLGMILFIRYREQPSDKIILAQIFIFGVLIQIKAYAGIIVLIGLGFLFFWTALKSRANPKYFHKEVLRTGLLFFGSLIIALLVFIPTNKEVGSMLKFSPLWFPETMLSFADRFYWVKLANAISAYRSGGVWLKLLPAEGLALAIFLLGNLGTRVIGAIKFLELARKDRRNARINVLIFAMIIVSGLLPLLFIQEGTPWNTIQFFYYFLFLNGILAGIVLGEWFESQKRKLLRIAVVGLFFSLTLPTTYATLKHYIPETPPAKLSYEELDALNFLRDLSPGVVLTRPFDREKAKQAEEDPPRPLYLYETTAYVAAFSSQKVFLEDEMNLEITRYNWRRRRKQALGFFESQNEKKAQKFLRQEKIAYIYLVGEQRLPFNEENLGVEKIFDNPEVKIYQVR